MTNYQKKGEMTLWLWLGSIIVLIAAMTVIWNVVDEANKVSYEEYRTTTTITNPPDGE